MTMRDEILPIKSGPWTISTRVAGQGPLVVLIHGFPELALSWRHQIAPLVEAGFTVAAPDTRGFGASSKPVDVRSYGFDAEADDIAAIADVLGHERWVSIGPDWGSNIAWRTGLRFPDRTAAVFGLSVPYRPPPPKPMKDFGSAQSGRFSYIQYFGEVGVAEAELERDPRASLKQMFFVGSGGAPKDEWIKSKPRDSKLLEGWVQAPSGPLSFMDDEVLDRYAVAFAAGGFFGPLCWYRNLDIDYDEMHAYCDPRIHQPTGFLCGDKEVTLSMFPNTLEVQREYLTDLRTETIIPGAGHWIQQERPTEVTAALIAFLNDVRSKV
jgi:pimeloyl-ACP methyl ester carboxylesterase